MQWAKGYSQDQLDEIQEKFDFVFPADLVDLLREKRPVAGHDWFDDVVIKKAIAWPFESLLFDVEHNQLWLPTWGERPEDSEDRNEVLREKVFQAPKLIPLMGHRFLPETPQEVDNPVFSVYGSDIVYYGSNLSDYFKREFEGWNSVPWPRQTKRIAFWSELEEENR
jgi:hypothetical protein